MRLASLNDGTRDGRLVVVSSDGKTCAPAPVPTLQQAMESWAAAAPVMAAIDDFPDAFDPAQALAPLPRAWQWLDGSAFQSHGDLMDAVLGMTKPKSDLPLMYQGMSDTFLSPIADARFPSEDLGIDFEGEFGVIVDAVPMGTTAADAMAHIKLIVQINDWSLRRIAPVEMKTGFGWVQAKPPCSMAPAAVTPDELGAAWRDWQVDLELNVQWNGAQFGRAHGHAMSSSFPELVAHAAGTRSLCAGTVIGSGTVSNPDYREVGSSCIAERRGIELLDLGEPKTPFMSFGDSVRMEARSRDGSTMFGAIDQQVTRLPKN
jgi:fumarylacetoacetate (FAA) hydrolase